MLTESHVSGISNPPSAQERDELEEWRRLFIRLQHVRSPFERRDAIQEQLDKGFHITDVMLIEDAGFRGEVIECCCGVSRAAGVPQLSPMEARSEQVKIRTVNGEPLGKIKVGLVKGDARRLKALERRGKSSIIYREYGAEFTVPIAEANWLLYNHGWRMQWPRYARRNAAMAGELDCRGQRVTSEDKWKLVEVGSRFEAEARELGELQPIKEEKGVSHGRKSQRPG